LAANQEIVKAVTRAIVVSVKTVSRHNGYRSLSRNASIAERNKTLARKSSPESPPRTTLVRTYTLKPASLSRQRLSLLFESRKPFPVQTVVGSCDTSVQRALQPRLEALGGLFYLAAASELRDPVSMVAML